MLVCGACPHSLHGQNPGIVPRTLITCRAGTCDRGSSATSILGLRAGSIPPPLATWLYVIKFLA
jgi:hypothetical protein